MGDTRTYEDFAGTLGRRVARVKEACGGAVGKKQYGGVQERPKSDEELKAAIIKADRLDRDRSEDGQRRLWAFLSGYQEIAARYGTNPDQNLDWEPEAWSAALADHGVDTTGVAAWRRKYMPERADSLARAAYGVKDGTVQTKGKGGNIMNYTVYFKDGGLLPRSQRRVYQTGGKASAQDMLAMLVQGAQILTSGKGTKKQKQQAQQMYIQMYQEALQGNQQYAQLIQAVFDGVQQGNQELVPVAQIFQEIAKQYQNKVSAAEFGGRLDYITMLRNGGRPRYRTGGVSRSYKPGDEMEYGDGDNGNERGLFGRVGDKIDGAVKKVGDTTLRDVGNGIVGATRWVHDHSPAYVVGKRIMDGIADGIARRRKRRDPYVVIYRGEEQSDYDENTNPNEYVAPTDWVEPEPPLPIRHERKPLPEIVNLPYGDLRDPSIYGQSSSQIRFRPGLKRE